MNLTVQEVSDALKIRKQYIIALEEENFHELPGIAYANGYMKKYCELLNIPHLESCIDDLNASSQTPNYNIFLNIIPTQKISVLLLLILAFFAFMWYYTGYISNKNSGVMHHLEDVSHETYITIEDNKANKVN